MFKAIFNFLKVYKEVGATYRGVQVGEGCFLQQVGRDEYRYQEGEKAMLIQIDLLSGKIEKAIYPDCIKRWLAPYDGEEVSTEKRQEILGRICRYFEDLDVKYKIIE